jgi:hypothetical protein
MKDTDQSPLLQPAGRGLSCFYRNRRLYHPEKPMEQAEARAAAFEAKEQTIYLLPSPLLWYGVPGLLSKIGSNSMILAVEAEEQLYQLSLDHFPDNLKARGQLLFLKLQDAVNLESSGFNLAAYRRVEMVSLNGGASLHRGLYKDLQERLERSIRIHWQNRMTLTWFGSLWLKNFFYNCGHMAAAAARGTLTPFMERDRPLCIAGAGPSLETALPQLLHFRNQFYLLAVDTAVSALQKAGIHPDGIVCQDGQHYSIGDFTAAPGACSLPLYLDLTASREVARHINGTITPFLSRFDSMELLGRFEKIVPGVPLLPPVGSVGITALLVALALKPTALLFAGLDFAYYLGKSHARGTPYHSAEICMRNRLQPEGDYQLLIKRHPFRRKQGDNTLPCLMSDLVLTGYAETFTERLRLEGFHIPHFLFPGTSGENLASFLDKVQEANSGFSEKKKSAGSESRLLQKESLVSFLEQEKGLLEQFLEGDNHLWKDMDYLYRFFPDFHRINAEKPDSHFLGRSTSSARRFLRIINEALTFPRS